MWRCYIRYVEKTRINFNFLNAKYKYLYSTFLIISSQITSFIFISKWNNISIVGGDVDGALFMKLAEHIINGDWLGDYNKFTLVKSPGYSIWLAFANMTGVQYTITFHLLFVISVYLYSIAFQVNLKSRPVTIMILLVLPWFPYAYFLETYRDLFLSVTYLNCASITLILYKYDYFKPKYRTEIIISLIAIYIINVGILSITREDYYLVFVPPLILVFFNLFLKINKAAGLNHKIIRMFILIMVINIVSINLAQFLVKEKNRNFYGVSLVNDWRYGAFPDLVNQLEKFNVNEQDHRFVITKAQRQDLSGSSSNFAKYTADLENDSQGWNAQSCLYLNICEDVTKGWFLWALRDSMEGSGVFKNASNFQEEMTNLAIELQGICASGIIKCDKSNSIYGIQGDLVPIIFSDFKLLLYFLTMQKWHNSDSWRAHYERSHQITARDIDYEIARKVINGLPDNKNLYGQSRKTVMEFPFYIYTKILDRIMLLAFVIIIILGVIRGKFMFSKDEYVFFLTILIMVIFQGLLIVINQNLNYGLSMEIAGLSYAVGLKIITQIQLLTLVLFIVAKTYPHLWILIQKYKRSILAKNNDKI